MSLESPYLNSKVNVCVYVCLVDHYSLIVESGGGSNSVCSRHSSSLRIKSFDSLNCSSNHRRSSRHKYNQYRSLVRITTTPHPYEE